ncbi:hypothetical protein [Curtobacterium ammoniigenes]|uniref:hypothetical protein n=1 Tax=Curtobacterium ammoniigenes TaxID=395387 RepID=UPI0012ED1E48|nr:hypothetical protein [Curtobacterium ammoniigenes]
MDSATPACSSFAAIVELSGTVIWKLIPRPRGIVERSCDPVAADSRLVEHDVRSAEGEVGEAFFGSGVANGEAAELHPESETGGQIRHEEFGYESGIEVGGH